MAAACDPVRAALAAWRDGGPAPDRDPALAAHLGQCDACGAALEDLVGTTDEQTVARAFASIEARPGFAGRVLAHLTGDTEEQAPAAADRSSDDEDIDALLAAGARYAGRGPAGRSGMGMVIEYCAVCRERIDAADFRTGVAIQFKGQSYCRACKDQVLEEFAEDPEFQAQQRRAQREHARPSDREEESGVGSGIRPGMGRAVRHAPAARGGPAGGPNLVMIGGIAAGALVLVGAAVFFMGGGSGDGGRGGKPTDTARDTKKGGSRTPDKPGPGSKGGKTGDGFDVRPNTPPGPSAATMETQMKIRAATASLREKREAIAKFARENSGAEDFQNVDLKYKNFLEDAEWNVAKDDAQIKELRAQVEADHKLAREKWESEGNDIIARAISRAMGFASREMYQQALQALDDVPPIFSDLPKHKEIADTRAKIEEKARATMGVLGEWFDVVKGAGDLGQLRLPTNDTESKVIGDAGEQAVVVKAGSKETSLIFTSESSGAWADYEIEFEAKATAGIRFAFRVTPNPATGMLQGIVVTFDESDGAAYHKYQVRFEGARFTLMQDGQQKQSTDVQLRYGKPLLLLPAGAEFRVRSLRYKVTRIHGR
jgi:hypothetical protein